MKSREEVNLRERGKADKEVKLTERLSSERGKAQREVKIRER